MKKSEIKNELMKKLDSFFNSTDVNEANLIVTDIYHTVLNCQYSTGIQNLVDDSMTVWKNDISNYLTTLIDNDKYHKRQAYLALIGIITLVDFLYIS